MRPCNDQRRRVDLAKTFSHIEPRDRLAYSGIALGLVGEDHLLNPQQTLGVSISKCRTKPALDGNGRDDRHGERAGASRGTDDKLAGNEQCRFRIHLRHLRDYARHIAERQAANQPWMLDGQGLCAHVAGRYSSDMSPGRGDFPDQCGELASELRHGGARLWHRTSPMTWQVHADNPKRLLQSSHQERAFSRVNVTLRQRR